jgi:hypothetical protein
MKNGLRVLENILLKMLIDQKTQKIVEDLMMLKKSTNQTNLSQYQVLMNKRIDVELVHMYEIVLRLRMKIFEYVHH